MSDSNTNRLYKDRLFKRVFETKEDLLSLYNAVNNTDYDNPDDVEINTVEDFIYMGMKNDVSFLIYDVLNLYEHQSTDNPNMALRGFMYMAELYKGLFKEHKDLYSSKRIPLPTPQFIVFYNGGDNDPDESLIKMSDAYAGEISGSPALECIARVLNINYGHNKQLMDKCKKLHEYSILVQKIKLYLNQGMTRKDAIAKAVDEAIKEGILAELLEKHRLEVTDMLLTEYDELEHISNEKSISFAEGKAEGREEGELRHLVTQVSRKVAKGKSVEKIADEVEESINVVQRIYDVVVRHTTEDDVDSIIDELNN